MITAVLFFLMFSVLFSCPERAESVGSLKDGKSKSRIPGYNLSDPDKIIVLPEILHEISGITVTDSSSVACVQDENGVVFIYNVLSNKITRQINFYSDGDYEGIARVENSIYILRSDGMLFKISDFGSKIFKREIFLTGISEKDNEGLCWDEKSERLLIAPKGAIVKDRENTGKHILYGFNLKSGKLSDKPVYEFDLPDIKRFAVSMLNGLPVKTKKKTGITEPILKLRISAIGINPVTNHLFVISGKEKLLLVIDMKGGIKYIEKLDPELFNMPEGISFFQNGDMLISNEGENKRATILRFNYNKK